jgi:hypothetical protein
MRGHGLKFSCHIFEANQLRLDAGVFVLLLNDYRLNHPEAA